MTEREKITWQELRDLFGEMMPVEVASITANAGSVEEARQQLRELAALTPPAAEGGVIQADREAAWPFRAACYMDVDKAAWDQGRYDDSRSIQAFARHRLASPTPMRELGARIAEVMTEGDGHWSACTGCQEGEDGHVSTRDYPFDATFNCQPGGGCGECGGIGVTWTPAGYYDGIIEWSQERERTRDNVRAILWSHLGGDNRRAGVEAAVDAIPALNSPTPPIKEPLTTEAADVPAFSTTGLKEALRALEALVHALTDGGKNPNNWLSVNHDRIKSCLARASATLANLANLEQKGEPDGLRIRRERLTTASAEAAFDIMKAALQRIAKAPAWGAPDRWEVTPFEVRDLAREALESIAAVDNAPKEPLTTEAEDGVLRGALDLAARELEAQANDPDVEHAIKAAKAARTALADCGDALSPAAVGGER